MFKLIFVTLLASAAVASATNTQLRQQPRSLDNGNFCQGCKAIVSFAQTINSTGERPGYKEALTRFCELYYPASTDFQQGPCEIFVDGFFVAMDGMDPVYHCDQIGACGDSYPDMIETKFAAKQPDNSVVLSRDNKVFCEFCEQTVESVQTALTDPATVDQVRRQLDAFCDYLRVIEQDKQCHRLAHQYLNQALDFIRSVDPIKYCKSIQLCSAMPPREEVVVAENDKVESLPTLSDFNNFGIETSVVIGARPTTNQVAASQRTHYKHGPNCMICKTVVKEMFHFLKDNRTEANIILGLNRICKLVYPRGPQLDQCHSMVKAYTREMIELLIDETDPQVICMLLEQCTYVKIEPKPANDNQELPEKFDMLDFMTALDPTLKKFSGKACFECRIFIDYLKNTLANPQSQDYLRMWLDEHLCQELTDKNLAQNCAKMVDQYADIFFKAVAGNLNSRTACIELGVCHSKSFQSLIVDNGPSGSNSLQSSPIHRHRATQQATRVSASRRGSSHSFMGQLCDQCIDIVTRFDDFLSTHSIDNDVSVLIEQVCNKMPEGSSLRGECVVIVQAFGSEIANWIANMDSPRHVCEKMSLCDTYNPLKQLS